LAEAGVESEVKLRVEDAEQARSALRRLGARLEEPRHFEDNLLFDDTARSLFASGRVVRLRRTDHGSFLTFKGPRRVVEGINVREEHESAVGDPDAVARVLRGLGLGPAFRYQKYREAWAFQDVEIVVDETPVGVFLEIEGPVAAIHAAALALGRSPSDFIAESYAALFLAAGGAGDMVFPGSPSRP
jgi:adenylate cyclase class 2